MSLVSELGSSILLFFLVFGMSATVDVNNLRKQLGNRNALFTGAFLQFVVLPFLGFVVVKALGMSEAMGITLLVVTSSPGGSYSNWWCSMFNADLALSVTMTAISTLLSVVMLPVNLVIYATSSYSGGVVKNLDWRGLFTSLVVVIGAISFGLYSSAKVRSSHFNLLANKLGNVAGVALVIFSAIISSSSEDAQLWDREWKFYLGVAAPCILGLAVANIMTSCFRLKEPERVTVSVECCYQNVGIATSVAITMFSGGERAEAIGVPLYYGLVEALALGFYCIFAWKIGWTKAPRDESFCVVIFNSYEVEQAEMQDANAIEVVLGCPKDGLPTDLIFTPDREEGYTVDDRSLMGASQNLSPDKTTEKSVVNDKQTTTNTCESFNDEEHPVPSPALLPSNPLTTALTKAIAPSEIKNHSTKILDERNAADAHTANCAEERAGQSLLVQLETPSPRVLVHSVRSLTPSSSLPNVLISRDYTTVFRDEQQEQPSSVYPRPMSPLEQELHSPPKQSTRGRKGPYDLMDEPVPPSRGERKMRSMSPRADLSRDSISVSFGDEDIHRTVTPDQFGAIGSSLIHRRHVYQRAENGDVDDENGTEMSSNNEKVVTVVSMDENDEHSEEIENTCHAPSPRGSGGESSVLASPTPDLTEEPSSVENHKTD